MPAPNDQDELSVEETAVPRAWVGNPVTCTALEAECECPGDCPRDHENE